MRAVGYVLPVPEMRLYFDALGEVTFGSFDANGGQQSSSCAEYERFLDSCSGVAFKSFDAHGVQQSTTCAEHERFLNAYSRVTFIRFGGDVGQQSTSCALHEIFFDASTGVTFRSFNADGRQQSTSCAECERFLTHAAECDLLSLKTHALIVAVLCRRKLRLAKVVKFVEIVFANKQLCRLITQLRNCSRFSSLLTDVAHAVLCTQGC